MVIRCERCSTLYELDEALLSPSGSQVQCTRCQHVFTAFPPRAPGRTLVGVPPQAPSEAPSSAEKGRAPTARSMGTGGAAAAGAPARAAPPPAAAAPAGPPTPRPAVRSGPPPVYRPSAASSAAASPSAGRAPILKRDTIGTFESRLRWSARLRWLVPLVAAVVIVAGIAGWVLLSRRLGPDVSRSRGEAMALVALDDAASLEQALTRLDGLLRRAPGSPGATSDRALASVLRAAALFEEGESLAARAAARTGERERLRREQPPGWEDAERAAAAEARELDAAAKAAQEQARVLGAGAFHLLRRLQAEQGDAPELSRAFAAYFVLVGDRERATGAIRAAREKAPADPWLDLVEGWLDARDAATRERALVQLGALSAAHPELLRARYLLATVQAALGRREDAIATLEAVLAANGRHEAAKRLRGELGLRAAPVPPPAPAPAPAPAPQPAPARPPPRKVVGTAPGTPAASQAPEATPARPDALPPPPAAAEAAASEPPASTPAAPAPAAAAAPTDVLPPAPVPPPPEPRAFDPRRDREPMAPLGGDGG